MSMISKATKLYNNNGSFVSPIYTFFLAEAKLFTRQFEVQIGKGTLNILSIKEKCPLQREINTYPSISSFIDRVFSFFQRKKYGSNPSEMDIKVVIPLPTQLMIT